MTEYPGFATAEGTGRYALRHPEANNAGFFRLAADLNVSSLGIGTYLGALDEAADASYIEAVRASVLGGINFIDTAINYRRQQSERNIGAALHRLFNAVEAQRDELVVCTKAGFLTPGAIPESLKPEDVAGRAHSMAPEFLTDQIRRSRENLRIETIDVFYLHNPESQLAHVPREIFDARLSRAFATLEELVSEGAIRYYGAATWQGFRESGQLNLQSLLEIATREGGAEHHFRFVQLPFNLGMVEAFRSGFLEAAHAAGIAVVASASLMQTQAITEMPDAVRKLMPGLGSDAARAIQFARSAPGVTVALAGMGRTAHVEENLQVSAVPPLTREQFLPFFV